MGNVRMCSLFVSVIASSTVCASGMGTCCVSPSTSYLPHCFRGPGSRSFSRRLRQLLWRFGAETSSTLSPHLVCARREKSGKNKYTHLSSVVGKGIPE
ncbi:hypothetical protein C8J57DRAFT_544482 [Mycena rebaudengoi]|nr:hypothetical protein C8J57DRAFT_544482 [Mycena rebaudengoi]